MTDSKSKQTPAPRFKVRLTDKIIQAGVEKSAGDTVELRRDQVESLQARIRDEDVRKVLGDAPAARRGKAADAGSGGGGD